MRRKDSNDQIGAGATHKQNFDFKIFLHKDFIKEGIAAKSYLNKVIIVN
jgi:hypothetical protein